MMKSTLPADYLRKVELLVSILIAFFMPLYQKAIVYLITILIVLIATQAIITGFRKIRFRLFPFGILLFLYLIGVLYSDNLNFAWHDIETKLSFFLLPLIYGLSHVDYQKNMRFVAVGLVMGCLVSSVICYYHAFQCFEEEGARFCFEASYLAHFMHPTYMSLIFIIGLTFLLIEAFVNKRIWWYKVGVILVNLYLLYFVYKLYSIGPWVAMFSMISVLLFAIFYFRRKVILFFVIFTVLVTTAVIMVAKLELLRSDYDTISKELKAYFDNPEQYIEENQNNIQSIKARIILWNVSADFIGDHPFGAGTGDVKDELIKYYESKGMTVFAEEKLNPHNQFLQTGASIGIPGILALAFAFFYYLYIGFKERNYYFIALSSLFLIASCFESVLERQAGVLLLLFFVGVVASIDLKCKQLN